MIYRILGIIAVIAYSIILVTWVTYPSPYDGNRHLEFGIPMSILILSYMIAVIVAICQKKFG